MPAAKRSVEWSAPAQDDLAVIIEHIANDNPDAAQALKDEIEKVAAQLPAHPKLYRPGRVKGTREAVIRPNYLLVYAIEPQRLTILRVLHAAQQWP